MFYDNINKFLLLLLLRKDSETFSRLTKQKTFKSEIILFMFVSELQLGDHTPPRCPVNHNAGSTFADSHKQHIHSADRLTPHSEHLDAAINPCLPVLLRRASISRDPFYDMLATRKRRIANKK